MFALIWLRLTLDPKGVVRAFGGDEAHQHESIPAVKVTFNAVHPGVVGTNLGANGTGVITATTWKLMKPFALKPEVGAQTVLWAATAPELKAVSGHYYKKQALATPSPLVQNQTLREQVWQRTLGLVKYPQAEWATF